MSWDKLPWSSQALHLGSCNLIGLACNALLCVLLCVCGCMLHHWSAGCVCNALVSMNHVSLFVCAGGCARACVFPWACVRASLYVSEHIFLSKTVTFSGFQFVCEKASKEQEQESCHEQREEL